MTVILSDMVSFLLPFITYRYRLCWSNIKKWRARHYHYFGEGSGRALVQLSKNGLVLFPLRALNTDPSDYLLQMPYVFMFLLEVSILILNWLARYLWFVAVACYPLLPRLII